MHPILNHHCVFYAVVAHSLHKHMSLWPPTGLGIWPGRGALGDHAEAGCKYRPASFIGSDEVNERQSTTNISKHP